MKAQRIDRKRHQGLDRGLLAFGLISALLLCVLYDQLRVHWFGRAQILQSAEQVDRLVATETVEPQRGRIISADGRILACSATEYRVSIQPSSVPMNPAFVSRFASATGIPASEVLDMSARKKGWAQWDVLLTNEQYNELVQVKRDYRVDGIAAVPAGEREYPMGASISGLLGFVKDGRGQAGIEKTQQNVLAGIAGKNVGLTDGEGRFLPWLISKKDSTQAKNGEDIVLTIDSELQRVATQALTQTCESNKAQDGVAIAIDPKTGDILALASWPTFDPNHPEKSLAESIRNGRTGPGANPAVAMAYEPGSTFKMFTLALANDLGIMGPNSTVVCNGSKAFSNAIIRCSGDHAVKSHGTVDMAKCVEVSCNVTAATWGARIGYERYSELIKKLGILERPNVGLSPETRGLFDPNDWNKTIQMANVGFGQSINVTPIALASAFTVFANEGIQVKPRLIKSIGGVATKEPAKTRIFRAATANMLLHDMQAVIDSPHGTGHALGLPGYELAGKTGTAQHAVGGTVRSGKYISSFIGFVPAKRPQAVILVMVNSPSMGRFYGAQVAGPAFKEIARYLLGRWRIAPTIVQEPSRAAN